MGYHPIPDRICHKWCGYGLGGTHHSTHMITMYMFVYYYCEGSGSHPYIEAIKTGYKNGQMYEEILGCYRCGLE
jgi:hypothetical protein